VDPRTEQLIDQHLPLVEHVVLRVSVGFPRHVDRADLVGAGTVGLVEAARRYDESVGVPFARYAARRIRGAVLDVVRSADWAPRSVRHQARRADEAAQAVATRTGEAPTATEIADELGIDERQLARLRERVQRGVVAALDAPARLDEEGIGPAERLADLSALSADERLEDDELRGYLRDALASLPERHRIVVTGLYLEGRSFEELAELLGVTPSRVSQLRSSAIDMIRDGILAQYGPARTARPKGRVEIRQAQFATSVARRTSWRSRLDAGHLRLVGTAAPSPDDEVDGPAIAAG
jgi:RNA polymerase sigma factor for flagellar operon FliA